MPILLSGILIAVVLYYLFNHKDDSSLKRTLKRGLGYALLAVLVWAVLGFVMVRLLPVIVCGVVIFMALRWLLHSEPEPSCPPELPPQPITHSGRAAGYRMQKIRRRHLTQPGTLP